MLLGGSLLNIGGIGLSVASITGNTNTFSAQQIFLTGTAGQTPLVIRQTGGVAGTDEGWIYNDGSNTYILDQNGSNLGVILGGSNTGAVKVQSNGMLIASGVSIYFTAGAGLGGALDCDITRIVAGVLGGSSVGTWYQNTAGEACLSAPFTNNTATLAVTNLSRTVKAGRSYRIEGILQVSNSTGTEGAQIAFDGGNATATTFFMSASMVGTNVAGAQVSTSLAGVINYTTVTGTDYIILRGFLKANAGGTIIVRAAENTTAAGTLTIGAGSWIALYDTVPL